MRPPAASPGPRGGADAVTAVTSQPGMRVLFAVLLAGVCAFVNLYATQPLLPVLARAFGVGKAQAALTVSAPTIAVALASPFAGVLADRVGRRRVIVASVFLLTIPTALAATSGSITALVAWRFLQGLAVPGVHAVAIAYIGEAWEGGGIGRALAALVTGNVVGGFIGRVLAGMTADWLGWRGAFVVLALATLAGAIGVWRWLPEPRRRRSSPASTPARRSLRALATGRLVATYAVGFNVLFTLVATFTYVTFYLSDPPFSLGPVALSWMFVVYLAGAFVTPFAGRWLDRVGPRPTLLGAVACGIAGGAITLVPHLWSVALGLVLCCSAAFVSQSASTSFLHRAAPRDAVASASGVYVSSYYLGGSAGGILPAFAFQAGGWPACLGLIALVQLVSAVIATRAWRA